MHTVAYALFAAATILAGIAACTEPSLEPASADVQSIETEPPRDRSDASEPSSSSSGSVAWANPVSPQEQGGVADHGVLRAEDARYYMASTGSSRGIYPTRVSDGKPSLGQCDGL